MGKDSLEFLYLVKWAGNAHIILVGKGGENYLNSVYQMSLLKFLRSCSKVFEVKEKIWDTLGTL